MTDPTPEQLYRQLEAEPDAATIDDIKRQADDALFEATRDRSSHSARRVLSQVFERELDEIATPPGSSVFSEKHETEVERDKRKRREKHLLGAVGGHVSRSLAEHDIKVRSVREDGESAAEYILTAGDNAGREYSARFGLELAESLAATGGTTNLVERIGQAVSREVLREREKWFKRAGLL
jgi:hypothetical protein